jgi:glycogen(starch) synthase
MERVRKPAGSSTKNPAPAAGAAAPASVSPAPSVAGSLSEIAASPPLLFEIAWEVCAQQGGIYTVLRSKAPTAVRRWAERYWLVGPYQEYSAKVELEEQPATGIVGAAIDDLQTRGARVHSGRWLVTGRPQVLLIDARGYRRSIAEMKYFLWKDLNMASPGGDRDYDEVVRFGYAVADFLAALRGRCGPLIAHFHEWQGGAALPLLAHRGVDIATVFTTHATLVGRALSNASAELYEHLSEIDGGAVATRYGFHHRHQIECAAAHAADVFTTVSDITGAEAARFLGCRPDVLLPNGLNVERFAAPHEFQVLHQRAKEHIHEFVMGHFFPSYTFDLDRTLYVFTAGRYEYRNKGMDVFVEALHRLNERLKCEQASVTVVAFIITRGWYRAPNVETLNRQAMFHELRAACESIKEDMGRRLFHAVASGDLPKIDDLLDEYATVRLKRLMHRWRQGPPPTIVTHDLHDDAGDPVLRHLRHRNLLNQAGDPVKVVFHPEFITAESPILGMEYDHFVRGCHVGVFPSYYEPWGYTPMECVVRGVPAITSDLSGFGGYVMEHFPDHDANGLMVARRRNVPAEVTIEMVTNWLHDLTRMSRRDRIQMRNRVEAYAEHFDWSNLIRYYRVARERAAAKRFPGVVLPPVA